MKKCLVIILLIVYGTSSFGMSLQFHYCCGKLKAVDFSHPKVDECQKGGMAQMDDGIACCNSKQVTFSIKSVQQPSPVFQSSFYPEFVAPGHFEVLGAAPLATRNLLPELFAPPPRSGRNLTILYCTYRI